jgi:hypothetical protein
MLYQYSVSSNSIWASFDYGTIEANSPEEAREKAIAELKYNFQKANDALAHSDNTKGFSVSFLEGEVKVTPQADVIF